MTREQTLYRRMAVGAHLRATRQVLPVIPSAEEKRLTKLAVKIIIYTQCINGALVELQTELERAGMFRQRAKHQFKKAEAIGIEVSNIAVDIFRKYDTIHETNCVTEMFERAYATDLKIDSSVALQGVDRAYNIVIALCRLFEKHNKQLSNSYYFQKGEPIYQIPRTLECLGVKDYHIEKFLDMVTEQPKVNVIV